MRGGSMEFINLTPHGVKIILPDGQELQLPPSGVVARCSESYTEVGTLNGVPVVQRKLGEVQGLPAPNDDTIYIVSSLVLSACKGRKDVFAPDTGATALRNEAGQIIGVRRLIAAD
ncbi:MAG: hypothetical protein ABIK73_07295 [candidate division WOR-3 bacterium]